MEIEQSTTVSQEKAYEVNARNFFLNEIVPSNLFQIYMKIPTGLLFHTEKKDGKLLFPDIKYNPHDSDKHNTQLSIENLRALTNCFSRFLKDENKAEYDIRQGEYFSKIHKKDELENISFDKDWITYQGEVKRSRALTNKFYHYLKAGEEEGDLFSKEMRKIQGEKQIINNKKKFPPTKVQRRNIESLLEEKEYTSPLERGSFNIQENLCDEEYSLPFLLSDDYGIGLDGTLAIIKDVKNLVPYHHVYPITFTRTIPGSDIPLTRYGLMITNNEAPWKSRDFSFTFNEDGDIVTKKDYGNQSINKITRQNPLIIDPLDRKIFGALNFDGKVEYLFMDKDKTPKITRVSGGSNLFLGNDKGKPIFARFQEYNHTLFEEWRKANPRFADRRMEDSEFPSGIQIISTQGARDNGTIISNNIYDLFNQQIDTDFSENESLMIKIYNLRNSLPTQKVFIEPEDYKEQHF
ncbi:MAG: hypothetical protein PF542_01490 [Nanoarchaeota archaeon]|jgi:hypothetical protein|nr:hypothetical protein [Nanoarchaeota archaeon]